MTEGAKSGRAHKALARNRRREVDALPAAVDRSAERTRVLTPECAHAKRRLFSAVSNAALAPGRFCLASSLICSDEFVLLE